MRAMMLAAVLLLAAPAAWAEGVVVEQPWARATAPHADTGAVYATLSAAAADRLTGASTPVAAMAMVHENTNDNGVMRMREVAAGLPLVPGHKVVLAPGGNHLMLMGLKQQLKPGDSFPLTLTFAQSPSVTVTVVVGSAGAMAPPAHAR